MKEALLYEKLEKDRVKCNLCNHRCIILPSKRGICAVRENRNGTLYSLVYNKTISGNADPIEKKPIFHLYPGSRSFSIATSGCNFKCLHCQNYHISQMPRDQNRIMGREIPPDEVVFLAMQEKCSTIAYTYTEPTVFFEYALDIARLAHEKDIKNVFVTNGYMTKEALQIIGPYLDAANVDLKAFSNNFYKDICGGKLDFVLDSIRLMKKMGIWVEVTTLIIPTLNDSEEELRQIAQFIGEVGEEIPWHVSAFHPTYKLTDIPRTPVTTLQAARNIGLDVGLRYIYCGNIPGEEGENTFCYNCHALLIERYGYHILKKRVKNGACPDCGVMIDGVFNGLNQ